MPRAGGAAEKLADLPPRDPTYSWLVLTPAGDQVILALDSQDIAYAVPAAGGSARTLARPAAPAEAWVSLLGANATGALWGAETDVDSPPLRTMTTFSVSDVTSAAGATARPFWPDSPGGLRPTPIGTFADGDGWLVTGTETLADGSQHISLWSVAADGEGTRVSCSPATDDGSGFVGAAAITPTAVWVVVGSTAGPSSASSFEYTLVRVDRVVPPHGG
jgi:hypothetical protein